LVLNKILQSQHPKSFGTNPALDEMLFIIVHQVYELWFKQILFELDLILQVFRRDKINDNSSDFPIAVNRLRRVTKIWQLLIDQFEVLETMTPLDFLEFRGPLVPASGFQSKQFRLIEVKLGLQTDQRSGCHYKHTGTGGFSDDEQGAIEAAEKSDTLKALIGQWLERMPFFDERYWRDYEQQFPNKDQSISKFLGDYRTIYFDGLSHGDQKRKEDFDKVFVTDGAGELSVKAINAALFIMLYRDLPIFRLPFELLSALVDLDELVATWRYRHLLIVRRMIGLRMGTGGTSGAGYLEGTLRQYVFREFTEISTFFVERTKLPNLPERLTETLSFNSHQEGL